jgi:hypothetical protein
MSRVQNYSLSVGALILIGFSARVMSQEPWTQKDFRQWTAGEVEKILTDSPWAQTRELSLAVGNTATTGGSSLPNRRAVILRLRSALPIRQALARLRQLNNKYDKMNEKDKKALDERNQILLECPPCADGYVVSLSGAPTTLMTLSEAEVKQNVHLMNDARESRKLIHFTPPKSQSDEAVFFFERLNERGEPLISSKGKTVIVTFDSKIFPTQIVTKFEFDVAKMIVNGQVAF